MIDPGFQTRSDREVIHRCADHDNFGIDQLLYQRFRQLGDFNLLRRALFCRRKVNERVCQIGITGPMLDFTDAFQSQPAGSITMIPVAAPTHPLALIEGMIPTEVARDYTQLVLTDRSQLTAGQNFGVIAVRDWRLGDLGAKHMLLRNGLGWGSMHQEMIRQDLDQGRLAHLKLAHMVSLEYTLHMINRVDEAPGLAGRWLMQYLLDHTPAA